ncbi:MAG TPA: hypothetical protein DEB30_04775 [Candidatus Peribacter riflensis]|uniref:Two-component system, NtrC family, nitrogen regulation response regulator GlnG n=1 Tax=Candidatus Peribacter riflensis TaxID=1735162 RepID=A0A0S1SPA3_9BACT|nr:MAG: two component sigma54 specific Fis family transcriptional regulator [Candidatus Peribacter riflensis]OGJ76751.1 MAG: hypothetical protein A2398_01145 [Candidatus Peribacteria bacterium RIFOXYB1_FULL_57_12]ALM10887.1 MAG: two component sigma54 specific Fis family transcriptional regulator [Candidatus Peribacter riflensis]ALM11989.1 MAG: two-component system, NtrC family, nitrogen regulation response regulator GlnG [Candidatus Peribacter riflensis]ALM13092.1 MAG: two-component system, Ntr
MSEVTTLEQQADSGLMLEPDELESWIRTAEEQCGLIVQGDKKMLRALEELVLLRRSQAITTLIGEPGTGKEKFARFVHVLKNPSRPFVDVNMAGISEHLFESELFGHAKGAFTGANGGRVGRFEQAADGTLFLDEIGDMPYDRQGLLLRALEQRTFSPVGDNRQLALKASIVCATNADIHHAANIGKMRRDLHDRLCRCVVVIPSYEERSQEHKVSVIRYLTRKIGSALRCPELTLDREALQLLLQYPIDGNVRGIENVLERAGTYAVARGQTRIDMVHMQRALEEVEKSQDSSPQSTHLLSQLIRQAMSQGLHSTLEPLRSKIVRAVLEHAGGKQVRAARLLGITRQTLGRYLSD